MEPSEPPETGGAGSDAPGGAGPDAPGDAGSDAPGGAGPDAPGDASSDARGGGSDAPGGAYNALRRIEERLDRASDAAERLLADAMTRGGAGSADPTVQPNAAVSDADTAPNDTGRHKPPPAGWQTPSSDEDRRAGTELELLANILQSLRELIPPELQRRLAEALRELLLALRALIDWYLERVEQRRRTPIEVEDIPIL